MQARYCSLAQQDYWQAQYKGASSTQKQPSPHRTPPWQAHAIEAPTHGWGQRPHPPCANRPATHPRA